MADALAGLDQGELFTIPLLLDVGDREKFNEARNFSNLSRKHSAAQYGISA